MALDSAHGAIDVLTSDTAGTTKTVSGLSFAPKFVFFWWVGISSATDALSNALNSCRGFGFAKSTSSRASVGSFSQDGAATSNCGAVTRDDACMCTTDGAGGSDGEVDVNAFNSDGFQLIVDDALPQNITIFWIAWGGSDLDANNITIGTITEPGATGNVDYTANGFVAGASDQIVLIAGSQSTAAVNTATATDSGLMLGCAKGTGSEQWLVIGNADDASTAMDTDGYAISGECIGMIVVAGGTAVDARGSLTQFGTNNFRINWAARTAGARKFIYAAIKGGRWAVGETTINVQAVNNTATVSGLPFGPEGFLAVTRGPAENTSNSAGAGDHFSVGCASATNSRRGQQMRDINGTASSNCEIVMSIDYDSVLPFTDDGTTMQTAIDVNAFNSDGFQLIVDTADAAGVTNRWIGYFAFADAQVPQMLARMACALPLAALGFFQEADYELPEHVLYTRQAPAAAPTVQMVQRMARPLITVAPDEWGVEPVKWLPRSPAPVVAQTPQMVQRLTLTPGIGFEAEWTSRAPLTWLPRPRYPYPQPVQRLVPFAPVVFTDADDLAPRATTWLPRSPAPQQAVRPLLYYYRYCLPEFPVEFVPEPIDASPLFFGRMEVVAPPQLTGGEWIIRARRRRCR